MKTMMDYKGYYGSAEFSPADEVFHGKLEFIRDLVIYESDDAKGLKRAFHEAVDDSDRNSRSPDTWLIPAGCVTVPPPDFRDGEQARWDGGAWVVEVVPEDAPEVEPEAGAQHLPEAQQADTVRQKRQAAYSDVGDQLDAMLKAWRHEASTCPKS